MGILVRPYVSLCDTDLIEKLLCRSESSQSEDSETMEKKVQELEYRILRLCGALSPDRKERRRMK